MKGQILIDCNARWFKFSMSRTGQLDFVGKVEEADTEGAVELYSSTYFSPCWYTFLRGDLNCTPRVFVAEGVDVSDSDTFSYLIHIGALLNAVEERDSLLAGELYLRRKIVFDKFAPVTQYILQDFSVEILFSLCYGRLNTCSVDEIPLIYQKAKERLKLDAARETLDQALIRYFGENSLSLTLPLVGTNFYSWEAEPEILGKLTDNLLCVNLVERSRQIRQARQEFYESIVATVQAEPYNRHDENAILVCIETIAAKLCGNPGMERAGYLRSLAAEIIREAKPKKMNYEGTLMELSRNGIVVQVNG